MTNSAVILLLFFLSSFGGVVWQANWSDGPGYPGPVPNWAGGFLSETHMTWDKTPGSVYLDLQTSRHGVSGAIANLFAYPGDINGDGYIDIATSSASSGHSFTWSENDGTGTSWVTHIIGYIYGATPHGGFPVDINGDGYLDVVGSANSQTVDSLFWYENTDGTGLTWTKHYIDEYDGVYCMYGADIDNDGDNDVIAASGASGVGLSWWENLDGTGIFMQRNTITDDEDFRTVRELCISDLDQDGDVDIQAACFTIDCDFWVFFNDGSGLNWDIELINADDEYCAPTSISTGDLDADGDIDIAATSSCPYYGQCYWFENVNGSCNVWEQHMLDVEFIGANTVHVSDLTGDGNPDVAAGAGYPIGTYEVVLWENAGGTGTNWIKHRLDSGYTCVDASTADINNDSMLDVIAVNFNGPVYWLSLAGENNGLLTSSVMDMIGYPEWQTMDWEGVEPEGADMYFLVRGSNDPENIGNWSEPIQEPGDITAYFDSTYRFIQYALMMEADGPVGTPVLNEISFQYGNMGIEGAEDGFLLLPVVPNPSGGSPVVSFTTSDVRKAELTVFDLTGRQVFFISDVWPAGRHDVSLPALPSGAYMAHLYSEVSEQNTRFVVLD